VHTFRQLLPTEVLTFEFILALLAQWGKHFCETPFLLAFLKMLVHSCEPEIETHFEEVLGIRLEEYLL
jgi:hypothetical protein